jgi:multidrug resistance efflux pump
MTIRSLRPIARVDSGKNQARASQSLARKLYLLFLIGAGFWIAYMIFGPIVFMDADGMIVQNRQAVMLPYSAQIVSIGVHPGDYLHEGEPIAVVVSLQILDLVSDLSSRKAQFDSREEQIKSRIAAIDAILPSAEQRVKEAEFVVQRVERASAASYMTNAETRGMMRELFEARNGFSTLTSERAGLVSEWAALKENRVRVAETLGKIKSAYHDGAIVSSVDGTVGPKVVNPGTVLAGGDRLVDVLYGTEYVLTYLPTNRFYGSAPGQKVVITDGVNRQRGHIQTVSAITDQLPPEFQSSFSSVERRQLVRIALDGKSVFPLLSKVEVTSPASPANVLITARASIVEALGIGANKLADGATSAFTAWHRAPVATMGRPELSSAIR